ncbi:hypothetical protein I4U23_000200 [Adineta vaga]|nr:hypothetical protein I4U23_000200 [Adineta vaga]
MLEINNIIKRISLDAHVYLNNHHEIIHLLLGNNICNRISRRDKQNKTTYDIAASSEIQSFIQSSSTSS